MMASTITYERSQSPIESLHRNNRILRVFQAYKAADHEGYHHSPYDWWIFDARETSEKTCEVCLTLHMLDYRGDWIEDTFLDHEHMGVNAIRANVHPNCRCVLRWAGRSETIYNTPLGITETWWQPTPQELENLSPSQLKQILEFLRNPMKLP